MRKGVIVHQPVSYLKASQTQKSRTQKVSPKRPNRVNAGVQCKLHRWHHRVFGAIGTLGAFEWIGAAVY